MMMFTPEYTLHYALWRHLVILYHHRERERGIWREMGMERVRGRNIYRDIEREEDGEKYIYRNIHNGERW